MAPENPNYIYVANERVDAMPSPKMVAYSKRGILVERTTHGFLLAYANKYAKLEIPTRILNTYSISKRDCIRLGKAIQTHEFYLQHSPRFQNDIVKISHLNAERMCYNQIYQLKEYFLEGGGITIHAWRYRHGILNPGTWAPVSDKDLEKILEMEQGYQGTSL